MSDLRVNTTAIAESYLTSPASQQLWNVTPIWQPQAAKELRLMAPGDAPSGAKRIIEGVIALFEAKTSVQHREAVEIFEHDLLWDGPPVRLSNKGHLRLATYLFKYFAHLNIRPVALTISEPGPGRTLIELDAVAVSFPHRAWWLPATLLLPQQVSKNVHFKIGVRGGLDGGKVELFTGRLTNFPPFLPLPLRTAAGIAMGALPHAIEPLLGYAFDVADGGHYYAAKRDAAFDARHPGSSNPTWDWVQDLAHDLPNWAKEQAVIGAESAQAVFGKTYTNIATTISTIINFYVWLFTSAWAAFSGLASSAGELVGSVAGSAGDMISGNGTAGAGRTSATAGFGTSYTPGGQAASGAYGTSGAGAKYYKGPAPMTTPTITARPVAATGRAL
ncbi:hypothetical protein OEZ85_010403 [Tetradesmus obliquus]|uniref:Uncharacterized protein n=2 Tax=Tetradesmus obliquus TaxID=3088 RepID=A0ABY8TMH5_TETOB|nr:hypothetical protein OEZ85_010403 [Tetradesmus obliquus]